MLRCAADLHSLSDDEGEGDGDGEAAAGWGGRVGVAPDVSIDTKGFALLCLLTAGPPPGSTSIRLKLAKAARLE